MWKELGPLNIRKLVDKNMLFLKQYRNEAGETIKYEKIESFDYNKFEHKFVYGQLDEDRKANGICRFINNTKIIEGQFFSGMKEGFCRTISVIRYTCGWFTHNKRLGYLKQFQLNNQFPVH